MCQSSINIENIVESAVSNDNFVARNLPKSIQNEILKSLKISESSSLFHLFALDNAFNRPIYSIFPSINNVGKCLIN